MVATRDHCFGVPRLSQMGELHSLEVPPWDPWHPLGLGKLVGLSPSTELRFLARAKSIPFFFPLGSPFARANPLMFSKTRSMIWFEIAPEFPHDSGSAGFPHEKIAIEQQSRSSAA